LQIIVGINSQALQLTAVLLPRYKPNLNRLLKGSGEYPLPGTDIEIEIDAEVIPKIIESITKLGDQWLAQNPSTETDKDRDNLRQKCIHFILDEWIKIGEECQQRVKGYSH
jgi:hypothetical protein